MPTQYKLVKVIKNLKLEDGTKYNKITSTYIKSECAKIGKKITIKSVPGWKITEISKETFDEQFAVEQNNKHKKVRNV